jgi:hypothetical protein
MKQLSYAQPDSYPIYLRNLDGGLLLRSDLRTVDPFVSPGSCNNGPYVVDIVLFHYLSSCCLIHCLRVTMSASCLRSFSVRFFLIRLCCRSNGISSELNIIGFACVSCSDSPQKVRLPDRGLGRKWTRLFVYRAFFHLSVRSAVQ